MSDTVLLALIAAVIGLVSPMILAGVMFFANRANKREDWRRQDAVAEAAKEAIKVAEKSGETLKVIAETGAKTNKTGEATHALVNSQRIVMLRAYAVLARSYSDDHLEDPARREVAEKAEHDLSEAELEAAKL